ncbi:beta-lactamase family protein [Rhizobiaceae bacterium]|nr:beta-lactamase family protein [Rhizobiaceae bacterium]
MRRALRIFATGLLLTMAALAAWLALAPPDLIRVATNYSARMICSNVHVAGRDADEVLSKDVQAPGNPILRLMSLDLDDGTETVRVELLGLFGLGTAQHRKGYGCTTLPDGEAASALPAPVEIDGGGIAAPTSIDPAIQAIVEDDTLAGPDMRAIVVLRDGAVVAERYGEGFDATTPLLGWSMTKTVTAALLGRLEQQGILTREDANLFPEWSSDARAQISIADLLGMASDLRWNEGYGSVSDVTRMLFLEPDEAAFTAAAPLDTPDGSMIGKTFNYSSGATVLLSRHWQDKLGENAYSAPERLLFGPLGMGSAVIETDAAGTFIGGSSMYANARDWARFGEFLRKDGIWNEERLLPAGYVEWMTQVHPASEGQYGRGHLWREPPRREEERGKPIDPALSQAYWLAGHDGQSVAIIPDAGLVIVRLGLTPSKLGWEPENLAVAVKAAASR